MMLPRLKATDSTTEIPRWTAAGQHLQAPAFFLDHTAHQLELIAAVIHQPHLVSFLNAPQKGTCLESSFQKGSGLGLGV